MYTNMLKPFRQCLRPVDLLEWNKTSVMNYLWLKKLKSTTIVLSCSGCYILFFLNTPLPLFELSLENTVIFVFKKTRCNLLIQLRVRNRSANLSYFIFTKIYRGNYLYVQSDVITFRELPTINYSNVLSRIISST